MAPWGTKIFFFTKISSDINFVSKNASRFWFGEKNIENSNLKIFQLQFQPYWTFDKYHFFIYINHTPPVLLVLYLQQSSSVLAGGGEIKYSKYSNK